MVVRPELPPGYNVRASTTRGHIVTYSYTLHAGSPVEIVVEPDISNRVSAAVIAWGHWREHGDPAWVAYLDRGGS